MAGSGGFEAAATFAPKAFPFFDAAGNILLSSHVYPFSNLLHLIQTKGEIKE